MSVSDGERRKIMSVLRADIGRALEKPLTYSKQLMLMSAVAACKCLE